MRSGDNANDRLKNYEIFLWRICFALLHSRALEELKPILKRDHKEKQGRQAAGFRHGGNSRPSGIEN
jgi:hypothetical protein